MAEKKTTVKKAAVKKAAAEKMNVKKDALFTGKRLICSEHFRELRDVAEAVLDADRSYTLKEADEVVLNYMKGKVN